MAKAVSRSIATPITVSAGAATNIADLTSNEVQVAGAMTATYVLQGSNDQASWVDLNTFSSAGLHIVVKEWAWLRMNCTAYTSGTPSTAVAGRKRRKKVRSMPVPAASPDAGEKVAAYDLTGMNLQIGGTLTGTLKLQGSMNGSTWTQIGSDITTTGQYDIPNPWTYVRIQRTANGGTATAVFCGRTVPRNPTARMLDTTTNPTGQSALVSDLDSLQLFVQGVTTGTFNLQGSVDGTNYQTVGGLIASDGVTDVSSSTFQRVRLVWTVYQSGVTAVMVGNLPTQEVPS